MKILLRVVTCLFSFCISLNTFAALYDRGSGLIYDDVLNITWLQDANYAQTSGYDVQDITWLQTINQADDINGRMTWSEANSWAAQLEYGGYDDWRLASVGSSPTSGLNVTTSELGHMFYNNLGNAEMTSVLNLDFNVSFTDAALGGSTVSFLNVQAAGYWNNEDHPTTNLAWAFWNDNGFQNSSSNNVNRFAWAVRPGDVSIIPVPAAAWLFGSALVALGLARRK